MQQQTNQSQDGVIGRFPDDYPLKGPDLQEVQTAAERMGQAVARRVHEIEDGAILATIAGLPRTAPPQVVGYRYLACKTQLGNQIIVDAVKSDGTSKPNLLARHPVLGLDGWDWGTQSNAAAALGNALLCHFIDPTIAGYGCFGSIGDRFDDAYWVALNKAILRDVIALLPAREDWLLTTDDIRTAVKTFHVEQLGDDVPAVNAITEHLKSRERE